MYQPPHRPPQIYAPQVHIYQHSNLPGPTCPRCNSPYVNPLPPVRNDGLKIMFTMLGAAFGLCFWPTLALIPLIYTVPDTYPHNCHNCGMTFRFTGPSKMTRGLGIGCAVAFCVLLVGQVLGRRLVDSEPVSEQAGQTQPVSQPQIQPWSQPPPASQTDQGY